MGADVDLATVDRRPTATGSNSDANPRRQPDRYPQAIEAPAVASVYHISFRREGWRTTLRRRRMHLLLPAFRETQRFPLVFDEDPHWNVDGHRFVAERIAAFIRAQRLLE